MRRKDEKARNPLPGKDGAGWAWLESEREEGERKEGKMVERARELETRMRKGLGEALRGAGEKKQRLGRAALPSPSPSEGHRVRAIVRWPWSSGPPVDMPPLV